MNRIKGEAVLHLLGHLSQDEINFRCPSCHSEYTHVIRAGTLTGIDKHEAVEVYEGTEQSGVTSARRSAVEIVFECEQCPVKSALAIQQHKGLNLVEIHFPLP